MTLNLINRLKHRGYKQSQILKHVNEIKFNQRKEALSTKKGKTQKLVFVTHFCDTTNMEYQTSFKETLKQNPIP